MQMLKFKNLLKARSILPAPSSSHISPIYRSSANFQTNNTNPNPNDHDIFIIGDDFPREERTPDPKHPFYMIFPIRNPLFPQSSYFTKISTAQQELLTKMKVKYVAAFLTKEATQHEPKETTPPLISDEPASVVPETPEKAGKDLEPPSMGRKDRYKRFRDAQQASLFNPDMNNIVIYDENLSLNYGQKLVEAEQEAHLEIKEDDHAFDLPKLSSIEDVYQLGTLCRLNVQRVPMEGNEKRHESFVVLKALSRVQIKEEVTDQDDINNFLTKPPRPAKKDKFKQQNRGFSFFKQEAPVSPLPIAEEEADTKELSEDVQKYKKEFFDSFKFVRVEHLDTALQVSDRDFTQSYQTKMSTLFDYYWKLRNKVQVNVPELPLLPEDPKALDLICGFLSATSLFSKTQLQQLLQTVPLPERLDLCLKYIMKYEKEFNVHWETLEKSNLPIDPNSAKKQYEDIYNFLKRSSENPFKKPVVEKMRENMANKHFPPEILKKIEDELSRFSELNESHPDYNIQRSFLELLTALPFGVRSADNFDISHAKKMLDEDHYGLEEVKTRILEFIAVAKLKGSIKGKSLLLVGPPGVGKTSIGSSIARCLNRKFIRISLGGEHDVSVLKGHRKTYVGAYPGRLVQALKNANTENPVVLLDEVDKVSTGMRGNLQDTLLEVLDPAQNSKFTDHFLDTPVDLSNVLFICTANLTETIHPAVLDRMEVIQLSGYTKEEKKQILIRYLLPRALEASGLKEKYADKINITDEAMDALLVKYAREAGVRQLERLVKRICEKVTFKFVKGDINDTTIAPENLKDYVGLPRFSDQLLYKDVPPPGIMRGLAYNSYGGSTIFIETTKSNFDLQAEQKEKSSQVITNQDQVKKPERRGSIKITGSLGDVMQESTQIAYSYAKSVLSSFFNNSFLETNDVHIHFPDGASKKDGPSAGIAITSSLISLALNTPTNGVVAMTGEVSLTGKVLKIGGVKEKVLAAKRENIKKLIFPADNKQDVDDLKDYIKEGIEFNFADNYMQVMKILFPDLVKDNPAFNKVSPVIVIVPQKQA